MFHFGYRLCDHVVVELHHGFYIGSLIDVLCHYGYMFIEWLVCPYEMMEHEIGTNMIQLKQLTTFQVNRGKDQRYPAWVQ
jgi:hypothetical protein